MDVRELNRDQLEELKINMYSADNMNVSYGELAAIDELVSDEEVFEMYDGVDFTEDDFFCSAEAPLERVFDPEKLDKVVEGDVCYIFNDVEEFKEFFNSNSREGEERFGPCYCTGTFDENGEKDFCSGDIIHRHAYPTEW